MIECTLTIAERHRVLDIIVAQWIVAHPGRAFGLRKSSIMDLLEWHAGEVARAEKPTSAPGLSPSPPESPEP